MLAKIKLLCAALVSTLHMVFMIGQYLAGARIFAAPVDFVPPAPTICRTPAQRVAWLARGATFAWCTLAALRGTTIADAAGRAFATTEMFRCPVTEMPDAARPDAVRFDFGASHAPQGSVRYEPPSYPGPI